MSTVPPPPPCKPNDVVVVGQSPPLRAVEAGLREWDIPVRTVTDVHAADAYCASAGRHCIYVVELPHTVGHEHAHAAWSWEATDDLLVMQLRERTSVVFLLHSDFQSCWDEIEAGAVRTPLWDFVRIPHHAGRGGSSEKEWVTEAVLRVRKLAQASQPKSDESLFDPNSGRYDASRVASFLRVPLKELAETLGAKYTTVQKTPSAVGLQERLGPIGRVIEVLVRFHGSNDLAREWLNTPHRELDERTPLSVILDGRGAIIRDMLEAASAGIPT